MPFERILQIGVAALVAMSTALLSGLGEQHIALPLSAVIIAFIAVYVTDVKGWIYLGRRAADVLGLAAVVLAFVQWHQDTSDAGLLALLDFVIYGQFVLQFKKKGVGTYWLLIALSFMEAAVATALSETLFFGLLLIAYVITAIAVMTVFYLYREQIVSSGATERPQRRPQRAAVLAPNAANLWRGQQEMLFAGHTSAQQIDAAVNAPLWRFVGKLSGMTLCSAFVLFAVIPRDERGAWRVSEEEPAKRIVGFASEMQLGELGAIVESEEEVMHVALIDPATKESIELEEEPLFRGVVLTTYSDRRWRRPNSARNSIMPMPPPPGTQVVMQRYSVRPIDTNLLFAIHPLYSTAALSDVWITSDRQQISRPRRLLEQPVEYTLLTSGIKGRRMRRIVPAEAPLEQSMRERLLAIPFGLDGRDLLSGTRATAQSIVRDVPADDRPGQARAIASYLRDPANFRYTLDSVQRDTSLDPIEDFVTNNRRGHCEYYASAMVMMLRSVGIPCRLAVGFKASDWTGSEYQVRALDAHAWVEAYLDPDTASGLNLDFDTSAGAWMILDPTGAGGDEYIRHSVNSFAADIRDFFASMRSAWKFYVAGLNYERQQEFVYGPMREAAASLKQITTDRAFWQSFGSTLLNLISPAYWGLTNGGWFSWRGALAAIVVMLVLTSFFYAGRAAWKRLKRFSAQRAKRIERRARDVEFYRRLEVLLAGYHFVRNPTQTQREFAVAVGGQLAESPRTKHAAAVARHLVETFYRVRFGAVPLDDSEVVAVEQALNDLAGALAVGTGRRARDTR